MNSKTETVYYRGIAIEILPSGKFMFLHLGDPHIFTSYELATQFIDWISLEKRHCN